MWIKIAEVLELILGAGQCIGVGLVKSNQQKTEKGPEDEKPTCEQSGERVGWRREGDSSKEGFSEDREGTVGVRSMEVTGGLGKSSSGGMREKTTSQYLGSIAKEGWGRRHLQVDNYLHSDHWLVGRWAELGDWVSGQPLQQGKQGL